MVTHRGELIPLITDENRLYYWIDDEKHILHKPKESGPPASFRPTMAVLPPSRPPPSDSPVYSNTISTHKQTGEVTHEISGKKKHHIWWLSEKVLGWLWKGAVMAAGVKIMLGKKSNMTDPVSGRSCYNCGPYEGGDPIFGVLFILIGAVILPQVLKWFIGLFQDE